METKVYDLGIVNEEELKFAVIVSKFNGKFVYARHKERETWEVPGGHRELNEDINDTAARELREETGAVKFNIEPICDYSVGDKNTGKSYGRVYYAEIEELGELPDLEIGEIKLFESMPKNLTYPKIQPVLLHEVVSRTTKSESISKVSQIELTNMCMIFDNKNNKVLVQDRIKSWKGISFPGSHIEDGESIIESTIREIKEETGLTISNLELCGIINWYNDETGDRYFVFNYRTEIFAGELLKETEEGKVFWIDKDELLKLNLSEGLKERLPMFFDKKYSEGFGIWNERSRGPLRWM